VTRKRQQTITYVGKRWHWDCPIDGSFDLWLCNCNNSNTMGATSGAKTT